MTKEQLSKDIKEVQSKLFQLRKTIEANPEITKGLTHHEVLILMIKAGVDQKYFSHDQTHI